MADFGQIAEEIDFPIRGIRCSARLWALIEYPNAYNPLNHARNEPPGNYLMQISRRFLRAAGDSVKNAKISCLSPKAGDLFHG